jgi:RNA polymerase sigma factor (sigma-70 family)
VHCYRMPGSFAVAEDAVQETMLAAWQGIGGFTGEHASLRTWLYKIATSRCLAARRAASRRPARQRDEATSLAFVTVGKRSAGNWRPEREGGDADELMAGTWSGCRWCSPDAAGWYPAISGETPSQAA